MRITNSSPKPRPASVGRPPRDTSHANEDYVTLGTSNESRDSSSNRPTRILVGGIFGLMGGVSGATAPAAGYTLGTIALAASNFEVDEADQVASDTVALFGGGLAGGTTVAHMATAFGRPGLGILGAALYGSLIGYLSTN